MSGQQDSSLGGCLAIVVLVGVLGSCMAGGSDDPDPEPTATSSSEAPATDVQSREEIEIADTTLTTAVVGSTMLEQAILDVFIAPQAGQTASNAKDFVGAAINSQGHLCARAVEAEKAASEMYGVGCVTSSDGYGRTNYLVNTRTGDVTPI